ncbi:MAG TPA: squalene/phytoene synthase family protein [Aggregatilineales bacterium]|nr:squalene/phytoene synthase family protein [Aggregatilineales bacterium]
MQKKSPGTSKRPVLKAPSPLENAYREAEAITWQYSRSFHLATGLLPKADRRAIRALYGFCRLTDNIVDDPQVTAYHDLAWWRQEVNRPWREQQRPLLSAWAHTRDRYNVPVAYGNELIEGCEMDLSMDRYATFRELERYCYCVASTVGLMGLHILGTAAGVEFEDAKPYALKLGSALQLTNILRDVGEDARRGRIYLPLEDLARFRVSEADILNHKLTDRTIRLLQFEVERTYHLYEEAWPGLHFIADKARFAVAVAADVYRGILGKIISNGYNVFTRRAFLTRSEKLRRLPIVWMDLQRSLL